MKRKAVLLVAYGSGNPTSRAGLAGFEARCRLRFPGLPVRWAFTSPIMRERLADQRRKSDSVVKALARLHFENRDAVAVQPLQVIAGREYEDVGQSIEFVAQEYGLRCTLGLPLLAADIGAVASALLSHLPPERKPDEDVLFMAHGASHAAGCMYSQLGSTLAALDNRIHIGVMSGSPSIDDILPGFVSSTVWLMPLLSSAGIHALRDMAGSHAHSWRSRIESQGRICNPVLTGLVEGESIANIWLNHLQKAVARLD